MTGRAPWALLFVLALAARAPAGDEFAERVAALTGLETAESRAIDAEVAELVKKHDELIAKFEATKDATRTAFYEQSREVLAKARERASAAADARAEAIVKLRCAGAPSLASAAAGATSPYLCGAVRAATADETKPNDPWIVCACTQQYLNGVAKEVAELRERSKRMIARVTPAESGKTTNYGQPAVTAEQITQAFASEVEIDEYGNSVMHGVGAVDPKPLLDLERVTSFAWLAREAQREIALAKVMAHVPGHEGAAVPFRSAMSRVQAVLQPAKRDAYHRIQMAARLRWELAQREADLLLSLAEEEIHRRRFADHGKFSEKVNAIWASVEDADDAAKARAHEMIASECVSWDAAHLPETDNAIAEARGIANALYEMRRRFTADMEAWKTFGARDGAGTTVEGGTFNYPDRDFAEFIVETFHFRSRDAWHGKYWASDDRAFATLGLPFVVPESRNLTLLDPRCTSFEYSRYPARDVGRSDETAAWDAENRRQLAALRARYPEAEWVGHATSVRLRFDGKATTAAAEHVVSGAGIGESP